RRDFISTGARAKIHKHLLLSDLVKMARVRLRACDLEQIQIVLEVGIGLGVFSGENIGFAHKVKKLSAKAIRHRLNMSII
ncbi:unnamed protein product, partial [Didymodactylos carnosus]